jgi:hypothetical protein
VCLYMSVCACVCVYVCVRHTRVEVEEQRRFVLLDERWMDSTAANVRWPATRNDHCQQAGKPPCCLWICALRPSEGMNVLCLFLSACCGTYARRQVWLARPQDLKLKPASCVTWLMMMPTTRRPTNALCCFDKSITESGNQSKHSSRRPRPFEGSRWIPCGGRERETKQVQAARWIIIKFLGPSGGPRERAMMLLLLSWTFLCICLSKTSWWAALALHEQARGKVKCLWGK